MHSVYSFETRLECIRLYEEENLTPGKIAKKFGIAHSRVETWLEIYKYNGIDGLKIKEQNQKYDERLNRTVYTYNASACLSMSFIVRNGIIQEIRIHLSD